MHLSSFWVASGTGALAYICLGTTAPLISFFFFFAKLKARGGRHEETNEKKPKGKLMNFAANLKRRSPALGYLDASLLH